MQTIKRQKLLNELEAVMPGVDKSEGVEQSNSFVFKGGKVHTFNDDMLCTCKCSLDVTGCVSAVHLIGLLKSIKDEKLQVDITAKGMQIKGKNKRATLFLDQEILLPIDTIEPPREWHELPAEFSDAVNMVYPCTSALGHFYCTCIHLHPERIEATDNLQAARHKTTLVLEKPVLVRANAIKQVTGRGLTHMGETASWLFFKNKRLLMTCRKFVEPFPDTDPLYPKTGKKLVLPKKITEILGTASIFLNNSLSNSMLSLKLELDKGKLRVTTPTKISEGGQYSQWFKIKYDGEPVAFYVNPVTLKNMLTQPDNKFIVSKDRLRTKSGQFEHVAVAQLMG